MATYCHPIQSIDWYEPAEESWSEVRREHVRAERQLAHAFAMVADYDASKLEDVQVQTELLRVEFATHVEQWLRDTRHYSIVSKKISHPSYLRIIGMGKPAIPLLLEILRDRPSHWFAALKATTGIDVSKHSRSPSEARVAWLEWGMEHGYIDLENGKSGH